MTWTIDPRGVGDSVQYLTCEQFVPSSNPEDDHISVTATLGLRVNGTRSVGRAQYIYTGENWELSSWLGTKPKQEKALATSSDVFSVLDMALAEWAQQMAA